MGKYAHRYNISILETSDFVKMVFNSSQDIDVYISYSLKCVGTVVNGLYDYYTKVTANTSLSIVLAVGSSKGFNVAIYSSSPDIKAYYSLDIVHGNCFIIFFQKFSRIF